MPPKVLTAGALRAWSVYGEINVRGLGSTLALLRAFNLGGAKAAGVAKNLTARIGGLVRIASFAALGFGALVVSTTSAFSKFDSKMTESLAIMGNVSDALRVDMANAARKVALETQFSASEAAEAYFFLASAGFNAEQSLAALPQVAQFAQAGMFDMATATDLATDVQSAMGLKVEDTTENLENMRRVTDALVASNTLANATVQQFAEALTNKFAGRLKTLNKDIEEGAAALAAFADQGQKGRRAGQRMTIVFRDLATVSIKNAEAFEEFGVQVFDADENMRNISDIIRDFEKKLISLSTKQRIASLMQLGLNKRAADSLALLIGSADAIEDYEKNIRSMGGITEVVARKQLGAFRFSLMKVKKQIADVAISVGDNLAPSIEGMADALASFVSELDRENIADLINNTFQKVMSGLAEFLRAVGNTLIAVQLNVKQAMALGLIGFILLGPLGVALFPLVGGLIAQLLSKIPGVGKIMADESDAALQKMLDAEEKLRRSQQMRLSLQRSISGQQELPNLPAQRMMASLGLSQEQLLARVEDIIPRQQRAFREAASEFQIAFEKGNSFGLLLLEAADGIDAALTGASRGAGSGATGFLVDQKKGTPSISDSPEGIPESLETEGARPQLDPLNLFPVKELTARQLKNEIRLERTLEALGDTASRQAKSIGRRLIDGLIEGSLEMQDVLKMVLKGILNVALGGLFSFLDIASPSRLMMGVGRNITLGIVEGVKAEKGRLVSAMTELGMIVHSGAARIGFRGGIPGGVPAAVSAGGVLARGGSQTVDLKNVPKPMTPREAARDAMWQEVLRESLRKANQDGFNIPQRRNRV